jgi:D-glucosaminate-6-phosphate ammonia-lyase
LPGVYDRLGARPVINAKGIYSDLGGAIVPPSVWAAMTEANERMVDMDELLDASGRRIAALLGVEAARVTPGASAGIALATAACMTRGDPEALERLPDTAGLRDAVVLQRPHRYRYLRMVWMTGARIVEADPDRLAEALDPVTVAALYVPGHRDGEGGAVPLRDAAALACERGIPTIVDAAFLNDPPETMGEIVASGAGLACFSAKYFYGPNGGGLVAGRRDLIEAIARADFTGFEGAEHLAYGRPFKLDRHTIAGTVLALEEWLSLDHAARWAGYGVAVDALRAAVAHLPRLEARPMLFTMQETLEPAPVNCLVVKTPRAAAAHDALWAGNPRIAVHLRDDALVVAVDALGAGDEAVVARRLAEALAPA